MDRKEFMRSVYSGYWLGARDKIYGFMAYDRQLCDYVSAQVVRVDGRSASSRAETGTVLEVAIGTGYPIADYLQQAGHEVHGVDISPELVDRCRELNPAIQAKVGDAENLDYPDATFDVTYCFHSSWYFPNLARAIGEMVRVTKPGGSVLLDIQNATNAQVDAAYRLRLHRIRPGLPARAELHARNLAKVVLRRGTPNWHAVNFEVPTDPAVVTGALNDHAIGEVTLFGRDESDQTLHKLGADQPLEPFARLVFAARR
jgi:ubiquinone/menaquinone biosynthesis C-methylase UbiE